MMKLPNRIRRWLRKLAKLIERLFIPLNVGLAGGLIPTNINVVFIRDLYLTGLTVSTILITILVAGIAIVSTAPTTTDHIDKLRNCFYVLASYLYVSFAVYVFVGPQAYVEPTPPPSGFEFYFVLFFFGITILMMSPLRKVRIPQFPPI